MVNKHILLVGLFVFVFSINSALCENISEIYNKSNTTVNTLSNCDSLFCVIKEINKHYNYMLVYVLQIVSFIAIYSNVVKSATPLQSLFISSLFNVFFAYLFLKLGLIESWFFNLLGIICGISFFMVVFNNR